MVLDVGGMQMLPKNGDIVDLHWTVGYKRHQCDRLKGNSEIIEYDPAGGAWHWSGRVCGRIAEGMEYCPRCGKKLE